MTPFVPKTGLFCFEIDGMAHIFHAGEDIRYGSPPPTVRVSKIAVTPVPCAVFRKVGRRAEDTFSLQHGGNLLGAFAVDSKAENPADNLGCFLVNYPFLRVIWVLLIAVKRMDGGVLSHHALGAFNGFDFLAGVPCEPFVRDILIE